MRLPRQSPESVPRFRVAPSPGAAAWPGVAAWPGAAAWIAAALSVVILQTVASGRESEGYSPLAMGVMTEIPPDDSTEEITSRIDVPRILRPGGVKRWKPETAAEDRTLLGQFAGPGGGVPQGYAVQRDLWCLAFSFAPPRMIDVDLPAADLQMRRRRLWYMVYRVKNVGGWKLDVDAVDPSVRSPSRFELPVRFVPSFVMETRQSMAASEGIVSYRSYADRVVPTVIGEIQRRERIGEKLHDSVTMAASPLEPGEERLGVAMWEGVHPDVSFFAVIVTGLTNRFCFRPPADGRKDDGGSVTLESLELDFWHRGDAKNPAIASISIGYAGLFERVVLGGRLVEVVGRTGVSKARPTQGFARIGLKWRDLLDPPLTERQALDRRTPSSLEPLARVIEALGRVESSADRSAAVRDIFGDGGPESLELAARSVLGGAAGADGPGREALRGIGVDPEAVASGGLDAFAKVVRRLDAVRPTADRDAAEAAIFGSEVRRFAALKQGFLAARAVAVLDEIGVDQSVLGTLGARQAFDRVWGEMVRRGPQEDDGEAADEEAKQQQAMAPSECWQPQRDSSRLPAAVRQLAEGLFGAEGPMVLATATARHEGIDHRWFFRYEIEED